ncbi:MAG: hypothetical protein V4501_01035 [Pseudomonadota bacterium]
MVNSVAPAKQILDEEKEALLPVAASSHDSSITTSPDATPHSPLRITVPLLELKRAESAPENEGDVSPRLPDTHPKDDKLTDQDKLNYFGRWIEDSRFLGGLPAAIIVLLMPRQSNDFENQLDGTLDKIGGVVIATGLHFALKEKYKKVKSLNPLYRTFKTLATAGTELGLLIADVLQFQLIYQFLATAIFALGVGFIAIPYWLYREYVMDKEKYPLHLRNQHYKTGIEGWSKYGKTFLIFGMYVGEVIGTWVTYAIGGVGKLTMADITLYGAMGSVGIFVTGLILVPIINKISGDKLLTEKDNFRNNYVRSGITLGIALGSALGFFLLPGLLPAVAMAIGASIGSVIGGIALGVYGSSITRYIQKNWHVKEDTDNSWDYATRNSSYFFGFVGAAIGFFIPFFVPVIGGSLMGAAIGNAIASVPGWLAGLYMIRLARLTSPEEQKATTLPWTQRIAYGTMFGSMIGATIGFSFGWIGGPAGSVLGATLGFSAGAILGGLAYGLYDSKARELIGMYFNGVTHQAETVEKEHEPLLTNALVVNAAPATAISPNSSASIITILATQPTPVSAIYQNVHTTPRLMPSADVVPIDEREFKKLAPAERKPSTDQNTFFPDVALANGIREEYRINDRHLSAPTELRA